MNTKKTWLTVVRVQNPERLQTWMDTFGTDEVPIKSIIPVMGDFPGLGRRSHYWLDLDALTGEQRQKLIKSIAVRFELPAEMVAENLEREGVPVLAADVVVSSVDPQVMRSVL